MRYIVMEKDDHGGGAMDLGAVPVAWWRSFQDAQDGDLLQEGPYHITLSMHVMFILYASYFA